MLILDTIKNTELCIIFHASENNQTGKYYHFNLSEIITEQT